LKRIIVAVVLVGAALACVPQPAKPRDLNATGTVSFITDRDPVTGPFVSSMPLGVQWLDPFKNTFSDIDFEAIEGGLSAAQVPGGPAYIRFGQNIVVTPAAQVDLSFPLLGRTDRRRASSTTRVRLQVSGMSAWDPTIDRMVLYSAGAGAEDFIAPSLRTGIMNPPASGATGASPTSRCGRAPSTRTK
jgi:hypothetical protein